VYVGIEFEVLTESGYYFSRESTLDTLIYFFLAESYNLESARIHTGTELTKLCTSTRSSCQDHSGLWKFFACEKPNEY